MIERWLLGSSILTFTTQSESQFNAVYLDTECCIDFFKYFLKEYVYELFKSLHTIFYFVLLTFPIFVYKLKKI